MGDAEVLHAELALLAARFVLPGHGPDVDQAIRLACELLVCELDTPATVDVAALRYGTPLRDACPLLREMLQEQGFPAPGPDTGQTGEFRAVLRALAAGSLAVDEFYNILIDHLPTRDKQDELDRRLRPCSTTGTCRPRRKAGPRRLKRSARLRGKPSARPGNLAVAGL